MSIREPILKTVAITDLRPTQMTVGIRARSRRSGRSEAQAQSQSLNRSEVRKT
jgi:hypothetical protein